MAPGTTMNFGTCERNLVDFFQHDKPLRSITPADATAFRKWLEENEGQAENTLRRRCRRARQFFAAAIKAKLIEENPFEGMSVTVTGSKDKERFVTEVESQKILKVARKHCLQTTDTHFEKSVQSDLTGARGTRRAKWRKIANFEKAKPAKNLVFYAGLRVSSLIQLPRRDSNPN